MELMILIIYASLCVGIFKLFKIPLNKWTVPTALLGGAVLLVSMLLFMNYNHPHTKLATQYYVSTPIVAQVRGRVIEVNKFEPNQLVKKDEVLFRIDPTPYQAEVTAKKAELADAIQTAATLQSDVNAAKARLEEAKLIMHQKQKEAERYKKLVTTQGVSQLDAEIKIREALSAKATYESRVAELEKAEKLLGSNINGENTQVAAKRAALERAEFDLESTIVRAPSDGYISQLFLQEGMMAGRLAIRPVMTFIGEQKRQFIAAFRQNSLLRLKVGDDAEFVFPAIPGKVFPAKVKAILPAIGESEVQANGTTYTRKFIDDQAMPLVLLELTGDMSEYNLPLGTTAEVAVYTEHAHHLAMMRKILLRMNSWKNYLYLDH
ncbi:HlyD family secretion protein [Bisgaard Taxon 10/6]|uniref:HlyD family secretion protein n=1 Tax=Exercitatus varius TaxID=67857 RepID=A0ABT6ERN0_9PAST|nr:HlyD family secretion protein [Exercitatus varius]MDG2940318.1 HlyD family secretion protein [Exercitatus varius]MDG2946210.1 HlyD family secretion protein [Exercitatus varius]